MISPEVQTERDRCGSIVADLEARWRRSAARYRRDGTWNTGWPSYRDFVAPKWEQAARETEAAADGLAAIRRGIQGGYTLAPEKESK
jgi:hypothetical protein